jgi:uncharacterized protein with HEPN domain
MLDHAREAVEMTRGRNREDLNLDRKLNLALVRRLEIIGEAAGGTTEAERLQCPSIPWHAITGLRNRLIHGYDSVDPDVLWRIVGDDLPPLILDLRNCLPTDNP